MIEAYHDISITHTLMDSDLLILGTVFYINVHNRSKPHFSVKLKYPGKIQTQYQPGFFRNLQCFTNCSMKLSIRYNVFIDLDGIDNKLSSECNFNICFLLRFPFTDSQSFSQYKPLQNVHF